VGHDFSLEPYSQMPYIASHACRQQQQYLRRDSSRNHSSISSREAGG
jgi:hypothetical protein